MILDYIQTLPMAKRSDAIELINKEISEKTYNPLAIPKRIVRTRSRDRYFKGLKISLLAGLGVGGTLTVMLNPLIAALAATTIIVGGSWLKHDEWSDAKAAIRDDDFGYLLEEDELLEIQGILKDMGDFKNIKDPRIRRAVKLAQALVDEELKELELGEYENEIEADFEEVEDTEEGGKPEGVEDDSQGVESDTELFDSAGIPMEDDPNYRGVDNPWDPSEKSSPFDQAMAWCAEREHTDRVECKAIGLDYDRYMQEVARAVMDDGTRPSPAEVQARLDTLASPLSDPAASPDMPKVTQSHGEPRGSAVQRTGFRQVHEPGSDGFSPTSDLEQQISDRQETIRVMTSASRTAEPPSEPRGSAVQEKGSEAVHWKGDPSFTPPTDDTEKIVLEFAPYKLDVNNDDTIEAVVMCQEIGKTEKWMMLNLFEDVTKGGNVKYQEFKKIINYCSLL